MVFCWRLSIFFLIIVGIACTDSFAREYIKISGSSTVFPFITVAAEDFGRYTKYKTPLVESVGSGLGIQAFCSGNGDEAPDIVMSSRQIKQVEHAQCKRNGVVDYVEMLIGYDGIVVANSRDGVAFDFSKSELFSAISYYAVGIGDELVGNASESWKEVNSSFPSLPIIVYGPRSGTGTYDTLVTMVMVNSCMHIKAFVNSYKSIAERTLACSKMRVDERYIESAVNENLVIQKIEKDKNAFGIFSFSFLMRNLGKLQGSKIHGVQPEYGNIVTGKYPLSRPLYLYVKRNRMNDMPGLFEFMSRLYKPSMIGAQGMLSKIGLVAMSDDKINAYATQISSHK